MRAGPSRPVTRRRALLGALALGATLPVACTSSDEGESEGAGDDGSDDGSDGGSTTTDADAATTATAATAGAARWTMPAEETPHERTWMCWPSSEAIWGEDLPDVQDTIERLAVTIAKYEPVTVLCRAEEIADLRERTGGSVDILEAPVDDLWARDTLPCFVTGVDGSGAPALAAGHVRFNGWGDKQRHDGDAQLAALVATHLGIPLVESGLTGEGGGIEVDGAGSVLAAKSSWVNKNRNSGLSADEIADALTRMLGAERVIWVDGLAGHDITDGHIDTLARFVGTDKVLVDTPAVDDPDDPWVAVAESTRATIDSTKTLAGGPYGVVEIVQPESPRGTGDDFLATYMNYYVCNGAVIAPQFGDDAADAAARTVLQGLFADREIVMVDIDALAAGGGGIHCATQQQPKVG